MKVKFTPILPSKPGTYLRKTALGIDLITVIEYPPQTISGVKFEKYLGIIEMRGRPVSCLESPYNTFSEVIEEI